MDGNYHQTLKKFERLVDMGTGTELKELKEMKEKMIGKSVIFPESDPEKRGIITDIYFQPEIDLDRKPNALVFLSQEELPDDGIYPSKKLGPKILCRVQFEGYVHITEPDDLVMVENREEK